jgi:hypothetical protein
MAKFYLSSTFEDLKECREAVSKALRQMGHEVIGMENYTANGVQPLAKCLADVAVCDYYIGIFAWRYGYIPEDDNPKKKSITELEYLKAVELRKEPLIFMLSENASWPRKLVDRDERQIEALRQYLSKKYVIDSFDDCAQLTVAVAVAVARLKLPSPPPKPPPGPEPPGPLRFWERYRRIALGIAASLLILFIAYGIYRIYWPPVPTEICPRERVKEWRAFIIKAEKLDDFWEYPKGMWTTEPGDSPDLYKDDEALLVKGREMGVPRDLDGKTFYNFYNFKASFRVRFKSGGTRGAWVLRAQQDKASGYLFELAQEGANLFLYGWIYEQNRKGETLGRELLPFKLLQESQTLFVDVTVVDNRFDYEITFDDDKAPNAPGVAEPDKRHFQDDPSAVRWRCGTLGFLETDDTSVMRIEEVHIYPLPRNN